MKKYEFKTCMGSTAEAGSEKENIYKLPCAAFHFPSCHMFSAYLTTSYLPHNGLIHGKIHIRIHNEIHSKVINSRQTHDEIDDS